MSLVDLVKEAEEATPANVQARLWRARLGAASIGVVMSFVGFFAGRYAARKRR